MIRQRNVTEDYARVRMRRKHKLRRFDWDDLIVGFSMAAVVIIALVIAFHLLSWIFKVHQHSQSMVATNGTMRT